MRLAPDTRRNDRSMRQLLPAGARRDRSVRHLANPLTYDGEVARMLRSPRCCRYRSWAFFFLPRESPFDAARMDLESKALSYPAGQFRRTQRRVFRSQFFEETHHVRIQLVGAPWSGLLGCQRDQAPSFQQGLRLIERWA